MKQSPVGILKVTILGAQLYNHPKVNKPHLKVRVSNQVFQTDFVVPPASDNTGQTFTFAINSFYKPHGRAIEMGYFDGHHDEMICFGSVDADSIIVGRSFQQTRCILSKTGMKQMGYVLLKASFMPTGHQELNFRFDQATIRRKTGSCGSDNVATKLTIGQEQHQTEYLPNSLEKPPIWADKVYNYKVPIGLKRGFLQLVDDRNNVIGATQLNLEHYTGVRQGEQIIQTQTLYHNQNKKQINAADIKYSFINGQKADFGPRDPKMSSVLRAVRPPGQTPKGSVIMGQALNRSFEGPISQSNQFTPGQPTNSNYQMVNSTYSNGNTPTSHFTYNSPQNVGQSTYDNAKNVGQSTYDNARNAGQSTYNTAQNTGNNVYNSGQTAYNDAKNTVNTSINEVKTYQTGEPSSQNVIKSGVASYTVVKGSDPVVTTNNA